MYIKLIQPRFNMRPMDTRLKTRMSPPLGLYTIAAMFRDKHKVVVQNENVEDIDFDEPDLVGISINVDSLSRSVEIASEFRRKGIPVVAGGILVTTASNFIPKDAFDSLCIGAAEGTWPQIVEDCQAGALKPIYRCSRRIEGKDIVSPAYDMMPRRKYLYVNIFHTSRGCPFRCDFCYNSSPERYYAHRDVESVIAEVESSKVKHVMFIDDNFIGNLKYARALMAELKARGYKWNAAVSINVVEIPGLLDEMRDSGCQGLFIGFESINESSINGEHKVQNSVAKYEYAIEEIHKRGIMINASFVFGLDGDTLDTFQNTLDWIVKNRIETVTSHIITPFPGTTTFDKMKAEGRLLTENLDFYDTAHVVFQPKHMTPEQLYEGYLWMYEQIYSFKNIIRRIPRSRKQIPAYLMFNFLYRKWGKFTDKLCQLLSFERIGRWSEIASRYI